MLPRVSDQIKLYKMAAVIFRILPSLQIWGENDRKADKEQKKEQKK